MPGFVNLRKNNLKTLGIDVTGHKIAILGGGQLGKMLCQAGSRLGLDIIVMDKDTSFPCATVCPSYFCGDIRNYDDVMAFGQKADIITIEIEDVNVKALEELEKQGKKVFPQPSVLKVIKDKGLQKMFYEAAGLPATSFGLYKDRQEILDSVHNGSLSLPFVQKVRTGGYDGRGVQIVRDTDGLKLLMEGPSVVEEVADVSCEISVIAARTESGEVTVFPAAEMEFHSGANLAEYIFAPSGINSETASEAARIAVMAAQKLGIVGLLAVEMFVTGDGKVIINESAPRPHNSGHHTIEACVTSQYEMHLRAILGLPLGNTELIMPAVTVNLLGEDGHSGTVRYNGLEEILAVPGVYPHLYGKKETRPFRKMGHVTIVNKDLRRAILTAKMIKETLKITT